eukprot:846020-Amphidinium_carterae.2
MMMMMMRMMMVVINSGNAWNCWASRLVHAHRGSLTADLRRSAAPEDHRRQFFRILRGIKFGNG